MTFSYKSFRELSIYKNWISKEKREKSNSLPLYWKIPLYDLINIYENVRGRELCGSDVRLKITFSFSSMIYSISFVNINGSNSRIHARKIS